MRLLKYIFGTILVLYFQILIAPRLAILDTTPFFLLAYIIFISMNLKPVESASITLLCGLAFDVLNPYLLGVNTILLLVISYIVNHYHTSVTKDKLGLLSISLLLINLIYLIPLFLLRGVIFRFEMLRLSLLPLELLYNSFITLITLMLLSVVQRLKVVIDV